MKSQKSSSGHLRETLIMRLVLSFIWMSFEQLLEEKDAVSETTVIETHGSARLSPITAHPEAEVVDLVVFNRQTCAGSKANPAESIVRVSQLKISGGFSVDRYPDFAFRKFKLNSVPVAIIGPVVLTPDQNGVT